MTPAELSKALVLAGLRCLVDDELAECHHAADGGLELHFATGDVFAIGDTGIRHDRLGTDLERAR